MGLLEALWTIIVPPGLRTVALSTGGENRISALSHSCAVSIMAVLICMPASSTSYCLSLLVRVVFTGPGPLLSVVLVLCF